MKRSVAALALAAIVGVSAASQATGASAPRTLHLLDLSEASTPAFDAGSAEPRPGDRVFLRDGLYTWNGTKRGNRVGRINSTLTFMSSFGRNGATAEIEGQLFLHGGSIAAHGIVQIGQGPSHFLLPIAGGTGIYAGARGYLDLRDLGRSGDKSALDIHLITSS